MTHPGVTYVPCHRPHLRWPERVCDLPDGHEGGHRYEIPGQQSPLQASLESMTNDRDAYVRLHSDAQAQIAEMRSFICRAVEYVPTGMWAEARKAGWVR